MPRKLKVFLKDQFSRLELDFISVVKYRAHFYEFARHAMFISTLRLPINMSTQSLAVVVGLL